MLILLLLDLQIASLLVCLFNNLWIMNINNNSIKRYTKVKFWTCYIEVCFGEMSFAHFCEMVLTAPNIVALWISRMLFHLFLAVHGWARLSAAERGWAQLSRAEHGWAGLSMAEQGWAWLSIAEMLKQRNAEHWKNTINASLNFNEHRWVLLRIAELTK